MRPVVFEHSVTVTDKHPPMLPLEVQPGFQRLVTEAWPLVLQHLGELARSKDSAMLVFKQRALTFTVGSCSSIRAALTSLGHPGVLRLTAALEAPAIGCRVVFLSPYEGGQYFYMEVTERIAGTEASARPSVARNLARELAAADASDIERFVAAARGRPAGVDESEGLVTLPSPTDPASTTEVISSPSTVMSAARPAQCFGCSFALSHSGGEAGRRANTR
mgnify:CR=1 FL=1